jgi:hypothetical protein
LLENGGTYVEHTPMLDPIISPKYYIKFELKNSTPALVHMLEPWCDLFSTDLSINLINDYIKTEQPNTDFNLVQKFAGQFIIPSATIFIDGNQFARTDYSYVTQLQKIIDSIDISNNNPLGYKLGSMEVRLFKKENVINTLISLNNLEYKNRLKNESSTS